jgi:hypothetical protein
MTKPKPARTYTRRVYAGVVGGKVLTLGKTLDGADVEFFQIPNGFRVVRAKLTYSI